MLLDKCPLSGKMGRGGGDVEQNSLGRGVSGGPGSALREGNLGTTKKNTLLKIRIKFSFYLQVNKSL